MSNDEFLSIGAKAEPISTPDSRSTSDLQFQRAEPVAAGGSKCQVCGKAIIQDYFRARGQVVCPVCAEDLRVSSKSPSLKSMPRAILYGCGAAVAGSLLYSIVSIVTGYQLALVSIVVGVMIGKATRHGSKGLGGRPQQILAVALTYFAITTSYLTTAIYDFARNPEASAEAPSDKSVTAAEGDGAAPAPKAPEGSAKADSPEGGFAVLLVSLVALVVAAPFFALESGFSGILSLLILFFGLKQAWTLTARSDIQVTGPYPPSSAA